MRHMHLTLVWLAIATTAAAQGKTEALNGYAEWRQGTEIIVDGQRVTFTASTKFTGKGDAKDFASIPLGYEVKVTGIRRPDGFVEARTVEAKPNGVDAFEAETLAEVQQIEALLLDAGFYPGNPENHRLLRRGPDVDRVKRIALRLIPPYKSKDGFRFYVVEDRDWNASAFANGMILVNQGLLRDMDDDQVALVLGHELVHATHEHTRRKKTKGMWVRPLFDAGGVAAGSTTDGRTREAVLKAIGLTSLAASNGYGRDLEDQADRVGLRYAYEAGFDVTKASMLWNRFREKYGDHSGIVNFFLEGHSLNAVRSENLRRQVALNYPQLVDKLKAAEATASTPSELNAGASSKSPAREDAPSEAPKFDVWVDRHYSSWENLLQSELSINGQLVDVFTSDRTSPVGDYLKAGWNTVILKTTAEAHATRDNGLRFRLGPVVPGGRGRDRLMTPVLWEFHNDTDWSLENGEFRHRHGPTVKEVSLSFALYFAGLDHENEEPAAGDYILQGTPQSESRTASVTATISVNGTMLNTFTSSPRGVAITSLLRAGRNEITVVSNRVAGVVEDNDIEFTVFGPVEWDVQQNGFVGPRVMQFGGMAGWRRNPRTGSLVSPANPAADRIERVIPLILKEAPASRIRSPEPVGRRQSEAPDH